MRNTACPNCGEPLADALAIIEDDGACPHCGTLRDELFDIALETDPDRSPEEVIDDNHAPEVDA
jgi:RNA polymerase subunit RPABC4/transcription elongation factor Spt4